ncbi:MAG TPA: hypothetical protein VIZ60_17295 [Rubrobacter sp.]
MDIEEHELGRDLGIPSLVRAPTEEVVDSLFAAFCDHDIINLGDDGVFAEGAHGKDDLIPVVLDEQNGLLTHQIPLLAAHREKRTPPARM